MWGYGYGGGGGGCYEIAEVRRGGRAFRSPHAHSNTTRFASPLGSFSCSVEEINLEFKRDDDFVFGELKNDIINGPDEDNVMTLKPQFIDWLLYDDS